MKANIYLEKITQTYRLETDNEECDGAVDLGGDDKVYDELKEIARCCLQWLKDNDKFEVTPLVHDSSLGECEGLVDEKMHFDNGEYYSIKDFNKFFGLK